MILKQRLDEEDSVRHLGATQNMKTSKTDESKNNKKIKILKYSNIEIAKDSSLSKDRNLGKVRKDQNKQKSQISPGFENKGKRRNEKSHTPNASYKYGENQKKIQSFVDDDIDIPTPNMSNASSRRQEHAENEVRNTKQIQKETESIVPPLLLKDIGFSKNTQNTGTGKLTRTTMNTTQIRDKLPVKNIKSTVNPAHSNQKSNENSK